MNGVRYMGSNEHKSSPSDACQTATTGSAVSTISRIGLAWTRRRADLTRMADIDNILTDVDKRVADLNPTAAFLAAEAAPDDGWIASTSAGGRRHHPRPGTVSRGIEGRGPATSTSGMTISLAIDSHLPCPLTPPLEGNQPECAIAPAHLRGQVPLAGVGDQVLRQTRTRFRRVSSYRNSIEWPRGRLAIR